MILLKKEYIPTDKWCLYMHANKVNGKKYIGICSINPERRWGSNGSGYMHQKKFWNDIKKHGWNSFEHIILAAGLDREEADCAETELIKRYETQKNGYNILPGGLDGKGKRHTKWSKEKIGKHFRKPVNQISIETGTIIKTYPSIRAAHKETGINFGNISSCCCRTKGYGTVGGYIWRHADEGEISSEELETVRKNMIWRMVEKVDAITGEVLAVYPSIRSAAEEVCADPSQISGCCKGRHKTAKGFAWRYIKSCMTPE